MLELYEKVIPEYSFREYKRFRLRTHNSQRELLELLIPPLVDRALDVFGKKYKYTIHESLSLEIYPDPQAFSVRIAGLPSISPQGVCFGKVVMSRSPSDGNFNWAQVIWHELAHVYHIQLSDYHVARWFTEGLAEYETNVFDPSWSRHYDQELASQVFLDAIPSVTQFDHGFTQSRTLLGVVRAYHLASLAIHFIAETWGFDALPQMLRAWGEHKTQEQVFRDVLKVSYAEFDRKFLTWLKNKYLNFSNQLMVDVDDLPSLPTLEKSLMRSANNPRLWAQLALAQQQAGQLDPSEASMKRALELAPSDPTVQSYAMAHRLRLGRARDAARHGQKVLEAGKDSYALRMNMGAASLMLEDTMAARVHFEAAIAQYEDGVDAWVQLLWLGKNLKDDALYARALERLFVLNQNDSMVPKLRGELAIKQGKWEVVRECGERWVDINPFDPESHRMVLAAAAVRKDGARAELAWQALLLVQPQEAQALRREAKAYFTSMGDAARAAKF
jgi:tetratricopeptide (TPR) repeat protein